MNQTSDRPTLVVLSPDAWDSLLRLQQQIPGRMTDRYRVVFVEPGRRLGGKQLLSALKALPNLWRASLSTHADGVEVVSGPPQVPAFRNQLPKAVLRWSFPLTAKANLWLGRAHLRRLYRTAQIDDPIVLSFGFGPIGPEIHRLFGDPLHRLSCYVIYDEQAEFLHNERVSELVAKADSAATVAADLVLATSPSQFDRRLDMNDNVHFMPNGVDFEHFATEPTTPPSESDDLGNLPGPIIGYAGWMGYQLDLELLCDVADNYSDGSVVLVGPDHLPDTDAARQLRSKPNVHFLGRRDPADLPTLVHQFDVALLPYLLEGHTRSIYPLKLHEYLAAGRSIVATDLPNLAQHADVIRICDSRESFVRQVADAAEDHGTEAIERRIETAREYSWDARADQVDALVTQLLADPRT